MAEFEKGCFCKSAKGHDTGTIYIVVSDNSGIYVADGRNKKMANPKKKNPIHLIKLNYKDDNITEKLASGKLKDEDIKYSIKNYLIHMN